MQALTVNCAWAAMVSVPLFWNAIPVRDEVRQYGIAWRCLGRTEDIGDPTPYAPALAQEVSRCVGSVLHVADAESRPVRALPPVG